MIKLRLVKKLKRIKRPGDAMIVVGRFGRIQLIMACPGCGDLTMSTGKHEFDPKTKTYVPAIRHNKNFKGCGWYGHLLNGVFVEDLFP